MPVRGAEEGVLEDPDEGVEVVEELERVRLLAADLSRLSIVITSSIFIADIWFSHLSVVKLSPLLIMG